MEIRPVSMLIRASFDNKRLLSLLGKGDHNHRIWGCGTSKIQQFICSYLAAKSSNNRNFFFRTISRQDGILSHHCRIWCSTLCLCPRKNSSTKRGKNKQRRNQKHKRN